MKQLGDKDHFPEFKPGDAVTFNPYGRPNSCVVTDVFNDPRSGELMYGLRGAAVTRTSGRSIQESKDFRPYPALLSIPHEILLRCREPSLEMAVERFNDGQFKVASSAIERLASSFDPGLRSYVLGALCLATGRPFDASAYFKTSFESGVLGAKDRLDSDFQPLLLVFASESGSPFCAVLCDRSQKNEVLKIAESNLLRSVSEYPQLGVRPEDQVPSLRIAMVDRYDFNSFQSAGRAGELRGAAIPGALRTPGQGSRMGL